MPDSRLRILFAHQAAADLEDIYFYTASRWGEEQARVYKARMLDALNLLAENPEMGLLDTRGRSGFRSFRVGSHRIWYRREGSALFVIRVLHTKRQSMDLSAMDQAD